MSAPPSILSFGSLNIDHVYQVDAFVRAGESIPTRGYEIHPGGKGANQSVALARAGLRVRHGGAVGRDGLWLVELLQKEGVDTSHIQILDTVTGHAMIQVDRAGDNAIFVHPGANMAQEVGDMIKTIHSSPPGTWLLLQNEINDVSRLIDAGYDHGLKICLNPAPLDDRLRDTPIEKVDILIVNQPEGAALSGETEPARILSTLKARFGVPEIVLTLGGDGCRVAEGENVESIPAYPVKAVDTTAAGDTFIGYYLAERLRGKVPVRAARLASRAAALAVTRAGAMPSIPRREELDQSDGE